MFTFSLKDGACARCFFTEHSSAAAFNAVLDRLIRVYCKTLVLCIDPFPTGKSYTHVYFNLLVLNVLTGLTVARS